MANSSDHNSNPLSKPPEGSFEKAEKYISKLVHLMDTTHVIVNHSDLSKFDPGSMQDHYWVDLQEYRIEVSHSKQPNSGQDAYVLVFTNLQRIKDELAQNPDQECLQKVILAYSKLNAQQFQRFKTSAKNQLEERRRIEEDKKFQDALKPIDNLLDNPSNTIETEANSEPKNQLKDGVLKPEEKLGYDSEVLSSQI